MVPTIENKMLEFLWQEYACGCMAELRVDVTAAGVHFYSSPATHILVFTVIHVHHRCHATWKPQSLYIVQ